MMAGMSNSLPVTVGAAVRAEMARKGIFQQHVADVLGVTRQSVSRRLTGEIPFDVGELERVADLLNVPLSRFLEVAA